jgi:hypothetical protein
MGERIDRRPKTTFGTHTLDRGARRSGVRTRYWTPTTVLGGTVAVLDCRPGDDSVTTIPQGNPMTDLENEWASVEDDPDLERDLGYRPTALETVVAEQYGQLLFLPIDDDDGDDDVLEPDAFIAADESLVVDLADTR